MRIECARVVTGGGLGAATAQGFAHSGAGGVTGESSVVAGLAKNPAEEMGVTVDAASIAALDAQKCQPAYAAADVTFPRRPGDPAEWAAAARFIVECGHHNGEVIRLDGALRMR